MSDENTNEETSAVDKAQQARQASDEQRQRLDSLMKGVPDYQKLTARYKTETDEQTRQEIRQQLDIMDAIIASANTSDPTSALEFAKEVEDMILEVSTKMEDEFDNDDLSSIQNSLMESAKKFQETKALNDAVMNTIKSGAQKGSNAWEFMKRNKLLMLGGATAAVVTAPILPLVGTLGVLGAGVAGIGGKEHFRKKRLEKGGDPESIEYRIRNAAASWEARMTELHDTEKKIPLILERQKILRDAAGDGLKTLSYYIAAGKEIQRRLDQEIVDMTGNDDLVEERDLKVSYRDAFGIQMAVLSQNRARFVIKRNQLASTIQSTIEVAGSLKSLAGPEMASNKFDLVVAKSNVIAMKTSKVVTDYRKGVNETSKTSQQAVDKAAELALAGRADSAEQFKAVNDLVVHNIQQIQTAAERMQKIAAARETAAKELEKNTLQLQNLQEQRELAKQGKSVDKKATGALTKSFGSTESPGNDNTETQPVRKMRMNGPRPPSQG